MINTVGYTATMFVDGKEVSRRSDVAAEGDTLRFVLGSVEVEVDIDDFVEDGIRTGGQTNSVAHEPVLLESQPQLTKREQFAMAAMQGILSSGESITYEGIYTNAVKIADGILKDLEK